MKLVIRSLIFTLLVAGTVFAADPPLPPNPYANTQDSNRVIRQSAFERQVKKWLYHQDYRRSQDWLRWQWDMWLTGAVVLPVTIGAEILQRNQVIPYVPALTEMAYFGTAIGVHGAFLTRRFILESIAAWRFRKTLEWGDKNGLYLEPNWVEETLKKKHFEFSEDCRSLMRRLALRAIE